MSEKRQPWGKWYWGDWRKDARLRRCSYAARGLWADMLSLMGGECDAYGYLIMEGQPLTATDLAGLLGGAERDVAKMLAELETKRVFSRIGETDMPDDVRDALSPAMPVGCIVSRRMIRDKAKEASDHLNGKRGGNPKLREISSDGLTPPDNPKPPNRLKPRGQRPNAKGLASINLEDAARDAPDVAAIGRSCLAIIDRDDQASWSFSPIEQWLTDGADAERHIFPILRAAMLDGRAARANGLAYFTPAIRDAIASLGTGPGGMAVVVNAEEERLAADRRHVEAFIKSGIWVWGVKPTETGCNVDKRILAEFSEALSVKRRA